MSPYSKLLISVISVFIYLVVQCRGLSVVNFLRPFTRCTRNNELNFDREAPVYLIATTCVLDWALVTSTWGCWRLAGFGYFGGGRHLLGSRDHPDCMHDAPIVTSSLGWVGLARLRQKGKIPKPQFFSHASIYMSTRKEKMASYAWKQMESQH